MELTPAEEFQYKMWEPPTRTELPGEAFGVIRFRRSNDGKEEPWITYEKNGGEYELPHQIVYHSPTGLEFGYGGSGPADTALNILVQLVSPKEANRLHQDFKSDVIARIPREGGTLSMSLVLGWIRGRYASEEMDSELMAREAVMRRDNDELARLDREAAEHPDDHPDRQIVPNGEEVAEGELP